MMFLKLLQEGHASLRRISIMGLLGGLTNGVILAVINLAADSAEGRHADPVLLIVFLLAVGIVTVSQRILIRQLSREVEAIIFSLRSDIISRVRFSDMLAIEAIGRATLYNVVSSEAQVISRNLPTIVGGAQAALLAAFTLIYLLWLAPLAALVVLVMTGVHAAVYARRRRERRRNFDLAFRYERAVVERLVDVLDGFKEVKLNALRSRQLQEHFDDASRLSEDAKIRSQVDSGDESIFGRSLFYLILAAAVFVAPIFSETLGESAAKVTAAVLFMMAPVNAMLLTLPLMDMVNVAASNLMELQHRLAGPPPAEENAAPRVTFKTIALRDVYFTYPAGSNGEPAFTVGPLNFEIRHGEIIFITGANGFGKSTILRVLTGIYPVTRGTILLDGEPVSDMASYRSLFSAVFTDYHLFERLYGVQATDSAATEVLHRLEVQSKVHVKDGKFSTVKLSSGQRKRLALAVALLESRPLLVLDEWAAEQDPYFRRTFYENVLPWIRERGHTVVAVSHDDRYFGAADRMLVVEDGQLIEARP